jgi:hypothetical protein
VFQQSAYTPFVEAMRARLLEKRPRVSFELLQRGLSILVDMLEAQKAHFISAMNQLLEA